MIKYEIINPSDKCFIEGDDFKTVCIAVIILGEGKYGLSSTDIDYKNEMPPIIFATGWFADRFKQDVKDAIKSTDRTKLREILETVKLEGKRSSLNDIEGRAKNLVKMLS